MSSNYETLDCIVETEHSGAEINSIILRASSELAKCESQDIERVIRQSITEVCATVHAEDGNWSFLSDSGTLKDVFRAGRRLASSCDVIKRGLYRLPWCLAQLNAGNPVLVYDTDDLSAPAEVDREFLKSQGVRSFALLPSKSRALGRTVLILSSTSAWEEWSPKIVEQCTLLEDIFSNAYQREKVFSKSNAGAECFQQIFLDSQSAMTILNHEGKFVASNKAFCEMLGYSEAEFREATFECIADSLRTLYERSVLGCISARTSTIQQLELSLVRKDGTMMSGMVSIEIPRRHVHKHSLLLLKVEDISDQKAKKVALNLRQAEVEILASLLIRSQEDERRRLSRELHDDIGQRLSLAASDAALLVSQLSPIQEFKAGRLENLRDELNSLCTDVHELSHDLYSSKLQHLGLKSALNALCRRFCQMGLHVDLHADGIEGPASKDVSLCLYRIAQESLNNALKHAHATIVVVALTKLQGMYYLTIRDNGVGLDASTNSQGLGLMSMAERAKLVKGQFRIRSASGGGTEIWVAVPDQRGIDVMKLATQKNIGGMAIDAGIGTSASST